MSTRAASRETRNDPLAITSCCRSQSATVVSSSDFEMDRPALLTTRSRPPKARHAVRTAARTASSSVTSTVTGTAMSAEPSSPATVAALSGFTSATTTQAPSAASRCAIALPIPDPAPVTSAMRVASGFRRRLPREFGLFQGPVLDAELLGLGDGLVAGDRLRAAHHVDGVDVELACDASCLPVAAEAEHADPRYQHDRRVRAAHRRTVRLRMAFVVGAVVLSVAFV